MTSTAISTQGSTLQVATGAGSAKTITAAALGFPTILTSAAHALGNGDVVIITGSTDPVGLNGTYVVTNVTTNTFAVLVDTTGGVALAGSPIATPQVWTPVNNFKTIKGFDGKTTVLDATNLSSTAKEKRAGLIDFGQFSFDVDVDVSDAGQVAMRNFQVAATLTQYKLTLPNAHTATWTAFVETFPWDGGVDKLLTANVVLEITGPVTFV